MEKKKIVMSKISTIHYIKLFFRSALLIIGTILYISHWLHQTEHPFGGLEHEPLILGCIWLVYFVEMILRFFPSNLESMGCQKQFARNYRGEADTKVQPRFTKDLIAVVIAWVALNGLFGGLYFAGIFDAGVLILISLAYAVCDMICILFFCPFQTWFMKNKCCGTCRIYNWDYMMMFTPLIFIPNVYTMSLVVGGVLLLVRWEVTAYKHPERFLECTNPTLECVNCPEKLCHHKKQLQSFLKKNRHLIRLREQERLGQQLEIIWKFCEELSERLTVVFD